MLSPDPNAKPVGALAPPAPDVILLLTIDAFRCGFFEGRRQLRDACPTLTKLAQEGIVRFDAHATYPATSRSVDDIHTIGRASGDRTFLASALSRLGYHSEAFITHSHLLDAPGIRGSFARIDDSLVRSAMAPGGVSSEALTDRVLKRIEALSPDEKGFFWAHYYDTHAPYVETPGSSWATVPVKAYAAEMRRTDAAIARLVEVAARQGRDVVVVITADHGEEFGEHGGSRHGSTLYEEVVRVPILVWRTGPGRARLLPPELPYTGAEIGEYIEGLASHRPLRPTQQAVMSLLLPYDTQYAIVKGEWKYIYHQTLNFDELYRLPDDPREREEKSSAQPAIAAELRAELLRAVAQERVERAVPPMVK